jgi:hypothetical protein
VGLGSLYWADPGELAAEGVLQRAALASAGAAVAIAGVSALCWVALRGLSSWRLAHAALLLSGAGFGLVVGAGGRLAYACAAPAAAALLWGGFAWRRRRAGDGAGPGEAERMLRPLAAALAAGIPVALVASRAGTPLPGVAAVGAWLLAALASAVLLGLVPRPASSTRAAAPSGSSPCATWWRSGARPSSPSSPASAWSGSRPGCGSSSRCSR